MNATDSPLLRDRSAVKPDSSFLARCWEWFWLAGGLRRVKQALPLESGREKQLALCARSCAVLAQRVLSVEMRAEDQAQASANELYRNAAYYALLALSPHAQPSDRASYAGAVWDSLPEILPQLPVRPSISSEALEASLRRGSLLYFAALPTYEQVATGVALRQLVDALLERAELKERGLTAIYLRRVWHAVALMAVLLALLFIGHRFYEAHSDLAAGKPWRASSAQPEFSGCSSPAQACGQALGSFFHTTEEENPWLQFDLGALHSVSRVELTNRSDCCNERAVPLSVEVSTDGNNFVSVARRDAGFVTWDARFPAVKARWVRLRVLKKTYFHLNGVRIF